MARNKNKGQSNDGKECELVCFRCAKVGHIEKDCWEDPTNAANRPATWKHWKKAAAAVANPFASTPAASPFGAPAPLTFGTFSFGAAPVAIGSSVFPQGNRGNVAEAYGRAAPVPAAGFGGLGSPAPASGAFSAIAAAAHAGGGFGSPAPASGGPFGATAAPTCCDITMSSPPTFPYDPSDGGFKVNFYSPVAPPLTLAEIVAQMDEEPDGHKLSKPHLVHVPPTPTTVDKYQGLKNARKEAKMLVQRGLRTSSQPSPTSIARHVAREVGKHPPVFAPRTRKVSDAQGKARRQKQKERAVLKDTTAHAKANKQKEEEP